MPGEQTPVEEELRNMYGAALATLLRLGVCAVTNKSSAEWSRKQSRPRPSTEDAPANVATFVMLPSFIQFICKFRIHVPGRPIQRKAPIPRRSF